MSSSIYHPAATPLEVPLLDKHDGRPSSDLVQAQVLELFDVAAAGLQRYVQACGLGPEAAEDVVQDAFVALFRHLRSGGAAHNLRGWLVLVAHRLALKQREREARRQRRESSWGWQVTERAADAAGDPATQLVAREDRRRLVAVFNALPDRDRQCLSLRAEGLPYREIAATLGISLGTVAKSVGRAVGRLSRAIAG